MFSNGTGADVMKRIAAPMVGGVITSTILELIIYPSHLYDLAGQGTETGVSKGNRKIFLKIPLRSPI